MNHLTENLQILNARRVRRLMGVSPKLLEAITPFVSGGCDSEALARLLHQKYGKQLPTRYVQRGLGFSRIFELTYELTGFNTEDWSMDFGTVGRFSISDRFSSPGLFALLLQNAFSIDGASPSREVCDEESAHRGIVSRLEQMIKDGAKPYQPPRGADAPSILKSCMGCHQNEDMGAPPIDFTEVAMKRIWKNGKTLQEHILNRTSEMVPAELQMPPNRRLSPQESRTLRQYLNGL